MKMFYWAAALPLAVLLHSCGGNSATTPQEAAPKPLNLETKIYKMAQGDCNQPEDKRVACAEIDFRYTLPSDGSDALKAALTAWSERFLIAQMLMPTELSPDNVKTLDEGKKAFFDAHKSFGESAMAGAFYVDCTPTTLLNDGKYLTLELVSASYTGGAHGNLLADVATFEVVGGKRLTWDDIVSDKAAFEKILEKKLRTEMKEWFESGFNFDETFKFKLPDAYGITDKGIYCHYVPYEIAPYALGDAAFTLSFEEAGALLKFKK